MDSARTDFWVYEREENFTYISVIQQREEEIVSLQHEIVINSGETRMRWKL